jgi:hypothetical protein
MTKPIVSPGAPTIITPVPTPGNTSSVGKNLNTGDNGFPINDKDITGQTGPQKYTYDTGAAGAGGSQGNYQPGVDVSAAYVDENGNPLDLKPATLLTLSKYLSAQTMGKGDATSVPNRYPVGNGKTDTAISTTDGKGYPAPLQLPPQNPATFAGSGEAQFDYPSAQYPAIAQQIKKGLAPGDAVDGNDLLAGVVPNSTSTANVNTLTGLGTQTPSPLPGHPSTNKIIGPYTSAVLSNNRFTGAASAYAALPDISDPDVAYDPIFPQQTVLGSYNPTAPTVTAGSLATIGTLLGLRATTTLGATSPGADPNSAGEQAAALLPGLAQLGATTIDQHLLQASDILASLTTDEVPSSNVLSTGTSSWGQLNDANSPFDGIDALGMVTLSLALVAGVQIIIGALGILLGMITPTTPVAQHDDNGRYAVGQYFPATKPPNSVSSGGPLGALGALATLNFSALLGINPTFFPFQQAMNSGLAAFYGLPQPTGGISISIGIPGLSPTSSSDSPGFSIVVSRSIIRGFVVISQSLSQIGGNPMNVINGILSMIDTIRNSKVVAAINVWAMLGDQLLSLPSVDVDPVAVGYEKVSELDQVSDYLATGISKSRMQNTLKLGWASNRSRANVLLPSTIVAASLNVPGLGQFDHVQGVQQDPYSLVQSTVLDVSANGRIDPTTAQQFEQTLDAEYLPFYFHDLRTNEIVGFHAFLAALSDDFNAAYEKTEGYGRVDPVRVYKSTERRINMSFYIAATSELDFDDMWIKINKLVTLVYPQYTQGIQLSNGSYTFTQPFSQLIGASPMIRIRLGNLLHTNYSQFGLARLFGLGNSNFKINSYTSTATFDQSILDQVPGAIFDALADPNDETYFVSPGTYPYFQASGDGGISISIPSPFGGGSTGPTYASEFSPQKAHIPNLFMVTANDTLNDVIVEGTDPGPIICTVAINDDPQFLATYPQAVAVAEDEFGNSAKLVRNFIGGQYVIPSTALIPTPATKAAIIASISPPSTSGAADLTAFMTANPTSTTANAVATSFANTAGNGLAGFIESMNFDWYDKVTWELQTGRAAPKLCKVTLTFAPVHDISPGIDHFGFNRAPVYPVGPMAQSYVVPTST